jgi:hypothetical protein
MELIKAERKQAKIKLGVQGPSGSGKTYSSLLIARGLVDSWEEIAVIDTENGSAHLYSHLGSYDVLSLTKPFSPERYCEAITECEKAGKGVIIIDSISPEWNNILELHGNMPGNSFSNWGKLTPVHNSFVHRMLHSPCHLIASIRSKQEYVIADKNGKMVPEKVGLQGVTREDLSYEFTLMFEIDQKHFANASKDRTGLFMDRAPFIISEATGHLIRDWCMNGIKVTDIEAQVEHCQTIEGLRHILVKYPEFRKLIEPSVFRRKAQIESLATLITNS